MGWQLEPKWEPCSDKDDAEQPSRGQQVGRTAEIRENDLISKWKSEALVSA